MLKTLYYIAIVVLAAMGLAVSLAGPDVADSTSEDASFMNIADIMRKRDFVNVDSVSAVYRKVKNPTKEQSEVIRQWFASIRA